MIIGAVVPALIGLFAVIGLGRLSGYDARILYSAAIPSLRLLSSTVSTAAATILALMVTVLSLSSNADADLPLEHYRRIERIAFLCTAALIGALVSLLVYGLPIQESDKIEGSWFIVVYFLGSATGASLAAIMMAVMLQLLATVNQVILAYRPDVAEENAETRSAKDASPG